MRPASSRRSEVSPAGKSKQSSKRASQNSASSAEKEQAVVGDAAASLLRRPDRNNTLPTASHAATAAATGGQTASVITPAPHVVSDNSSGAASHPNGVAEKESDSPAGMAHCCVCSNAVSLDAHGGGCIDCRRPMHIICAAETIGAEGYNQKGRCKDCYQKSLKTLAQLVTHSSL